MSTTTTTTTEVSSNSNSSCRLLVCLNSLPFHDQRAFRSLLGHIDFLRLSACCRSLRSSIRNDRALWQERYHRDFLSGAYYAKEMEFVLWCIRMDGNDPCSSDKRADLLENVDWYNTYRRRVSTENNWLFGRYNITHIKLEGDKDGKKYSNYDRGHRVFIEHENWYNEPPSQSYTLEYLPHSNLRSSNHNVYNSTLSKSPNVLSMDSGSEESRRYVTGDHYIAVFPEEIENYTDYNIRVLSRKHGGVFTAFDVPSQYQVKTVEGKWILLVDKSQVSITDSRIWKINAMVFDIDNRIMCPGNIDDIWDAIYFYETTNDTAIVYTARLVKDDVDRIEWALHQFSSNNPVVQLRSGWFELPEKTNNAGLVAYNSYGSLVVARLYDHPSSYAPYIIHSVASSGQTHAPRNFYTITSRHIPIPFLKAKCVYAISGSGSQDVLTDLTYNEDQVLQIPDIDSISHVIGDLYMYITSDRDRIKTRFLLNINTKEVIRKWREPCVRGYTIIDEMFGTIYNHSGYSVPTIDEYGEL